MKVLFVAPSEVSSGEAITAMHMATDVVAHGGEVRFLATGLTAGFLTEPFAARVRLLSDDIEHNRAAWALAVHDFDPDVVVFADYPLLFFPSGSAPLADDEWVRSLDVLDASLVTLDHLGYAQTSMTIYFGPAHLSMASATTPVLPARMHVALPCPSQSPVDVVGRVGSPFRAWGEPPTWTSEERRGVRQRFLRDERDLLVVHSAPGWAWRAADTWGLPYYERLSELLAHYLADLPRPVTVVSVNNGGLLEPIDDGKVRIVNVGALPASEFEALTLACDLMLTENAVSVSLGKAVCGLRPAALLRNSFRLIDLVDDLDEPLRRIVLRMESARLGAIFPYEAFPIWGQAEIDQLGLYRDNPLSHGFARLEVFGGDATRAELHALLVDARARADMRDRQAAYVRDLVPLGGPDEILRRFAGE